MICAFALSKIFTTALIIFLFYFLRAQVFSGFTQYPDTVDPKEYAEWQLLEM